MKRLISPQRPTRRDRKQSIFQRVAATLAVAGVVVGTVLLGQANLEFKIDFLEVGEHMMHVEITIYDEQQSIKKDTLVLIVSSVHKEMSYPLIVGTQALMIDDLTSYTTYTFSIWIIDDEETLLFQTIKKTHAPSSTLNLNPLVTNITYLNLTMLKERTHGY